MHELTPTPIGKIDFAIVQLVWGLIRAAFGGAHLMQPLIVQAHKFLIKKRMTLAAAESCTGGLLSDLLTRLPGSSRYFVLGIVAYDNKIKERILRVPANLIAKKGAVSKETARLMADSVRHIAGSDIGIGITGVAGPAGGSKEKPVGTVFIAIESKSKKLCKKYHFKGSRTAVRKKTALKALELLKPLI